LKAIEAAYIQKEIANSSYSYQMAVDSGEQVVVGVNMFPSGENAAPETLEIGTEIEEKQVGRLKKLKGERDNRRVGEAMDHVRETARSNRNIMPALIEAVKTYATVGEISDVLREVFGEYREKNVL
jgi:methylmalonyl-CoA mutase N-terminal domain/subunit